jgi:hypothetical protein
MKDEIFWGNILGLLKKGRWTLSLEEASALCEIYHEANKRSKPSVMKVADPNPIKQPPNKVKK